MTNVQTIPEAIRSHLMVPSDRRDVYWLRGALKTAIGLELATIPPYLYGLFSIKDPDSDVTSHIRQIAFQEMLHLGFACNLLSAAGGKPAVQAAARNYPTPLPGQIGQEGLTVYLEGIARRAGDENDVIRKVFMEIETPENPLARTAEAGEGYPTIGQFYKAVKDAYNALSSQLPYDQKWQHAGDIAGDELFVVSNLDDANKAIDLIVYQGEGRPGSPESLEQEAPRDTSPAHLAHYYRFKEIWCGRALRYDEASQQWKYDGDAVPRPEVYPLARVPAGGWRDAPAAVRTKLDGCNALYNLMLARLDQAWNTDRNALGRAIGVMHALAEHAFSLIDYQDGPNVKKIYGPEFFIGLHQ